MNAALRVGCCAELAEPNWRWVADAFPPSELEWRFFSTEPRSIAERLIRRPKLARYRACRELAKSAASGQLDLMFTHHPLVTCWTETFFFGRGRPCPHVAFAFNFTRLPTRPRYAAMRRAFATIDRFVVFSNFERDLYSSYFGLPASKIDMIHWGVRGPALAAEGGNEDRREEMRPDAICAVGSQARDYATLVDAMRRLPQIPLEIVATARNVRGLAIPPNVTLRLDIPRPEAHAAIRRSRFLVLPLAHSQVPCGHVTLVSAMYLSRAVIATASDGIQDYLIPGQTGIVVPPRDAVAMATAIEGLWYDAESARRMGENGRAFALANCGESRTVDYVRGLIERLRLNGHI